MHTFFTRCMQVNGLEEVVHCRKVDAREHLARLCALIRRRAEFTSGLSLRSVHHHHHFVASTSFEMMFPKPVKRGLDMHPCL